jgi:hypothetical protein
MNCDGPSVSIQGVYRDRLIEPGGEVVSDTGWRCNLIVLRCRILLAGFLHNDATAMGIQSMQVGRGDPAWDVTPPAAPDPATTTQLVDPSPFSIPVASLTLQYLNSSDGVEATATNRVQITATLGPNQPSPAGSPPFPLREFGLFGQLGGTPFMIDYIRHPLIEKDGAVTLERKVRLIL